MIKIGILVFNGVEELDFIAPFEVLSYANKINSDTLQVQLIAEKAEQLTAFNGLRFLPDQTFEQIHNQDLDILVVPGGKGRLVEMHNPKIHQFIQRLFPNLKYLTSVCTGSLILAEAGVLDGCSATTHHLAFEELANYPNINLVENKKVVANKTIITAAGVSSGLELGFYLLQNCFGQELAEQVAEGIEYTPQM